MTLDEKALESMAKRIAGWLGYDWNGLYDGRIAAKGFPVWSGHKFQGYKGDLIDLARELTAYLSASKPAGDVERMREALEECEEYFEQRSDVKDGSYGIPEPNDEMSMLTVVRAALASAQAVSEPSPRADAEVEGQGWRYEVQYGPEGEAAFAWVYSPTGEMVCTTKTHHARQIVAALSRLAAQEPVGWQWRYRTIGKEIGQWTDWADGRAPELKAYNYDVEERPLFAQPQPPQDVEKKGHEAFKVAVAHQKRAEAAEARVGRLEKALEDAEQEALTSRDEWTRANGVILPEGQIAEEIASRIAAIRRAAITASASDHQQ